MDKLNHIGGIPGDDHGEGSGRKKSVRKRNVTIPDLSSLYKSEESQDETARDKEITPSESSDRRAESSEVTSSVLSKMPEGLNYYLPPEVLRKLNTATPGKGTLLHALERLRSLLYALSTFLPGNLVQEKMQHPKAGEIRGEYLSGTFLFSDVSGFTALSERLAELGLEGAERLTIIMNRYFATMLEILSWSGGILIKFAGDATLVYFPEQENGEQVQWATRAGFRMFRAMKEFENIETPKESVSLKMKIGIGTGSFMATSVGSRKRMEYIVFGEAVHDTMAAESASTSAGQMIVNQASVPFLSDDFKVKEHKPGYYRVEAPDEKIDDFEIKAEKRRARGMIPLDATPEIIMDEMRKVLEQIEAIAPFLAGELIDRLVIQGRKRKIESEFRPTTVGFCNFIGLDALLEAWQDSAGQKRLAAVLSDYFQSMNEIITRFGGIISRIDPYKDGMKMLILFGAPVAHEDDTQRAVSASLAMMEELRKLNSNWHRKYKRYLKTGSEKPVIEHRIGITSGITFAGQVGSSSRCEYTVMGDDVNLAARLMGAADLGQVLISDSVRTSITDFFQLSELAPISVKGKSKPINIFQVDGSREDTLINRAHHRARLAGREIEYQKAISIFNQSMQGDVNYLIIEGSAGIGKSHFADQLIVEAIAQGALVFPVQCRSYTSTVPYFYWRSILSSLTGITSNDLPEIKQNKYKNFISHVPFKDEEEYVLAELIGVEYKPIDEIELDEKTKKTGAYQENSMLPTQFKSAKKRRRGSKLDLFERLQSSDRASTTAFENEISGFSNREKKIIQNAFATLLSAIAGQKPVLLFFEDAHWMDTDSQSLLNFLSQNLTDVPVLFISAQRLNERLPDHHASIHTLTLEPLNLDDTQKLISQILVSDLAPLVYQQSNGNPLFVEQITRWLKRTRKIELSDLQNILKSSNILQELILSSIESLPEIQQEIIKVASVIGYEFRYSEIQLLLPDTIEPATLSAYLRALIEAQYLSLNDASVDTLYGYQQSLVRDILYNSIPFERRRELHAMLAKYLSEDKSDRSKLQHKIDAFYEGDKLTHDFYSLERIASHFELSENSLQAAHYYYQAGQRAKTAFSYQMALEYYQQALKNFEKSPLKEEIDNKSLRFFIESGIVDMLFISGEYFRAFQLNKKLLSGMGDELDINLAKKQVILHVIQGNDEEAQNIMNNVFKVEGKDANWTTMMINSWLLWRQSPGNMADHIDCLERKIGEISDLSWISSMNVFLSELKGDWEQAVVQYKSLGMNQAAILSAVRAGEKCMDLEQIEQAIKWYRDAVSILQLLDDEEAEIHALVCYHLSEAYILNSNIREGKENLDFTVKLLQRSDTKRKGEIIRNAQFIEHDLKLTENRRFPLWDWQDLDDELKARFLFMFLL